MDYSTSYNKFFKKLQTKKECEDELFSQAVGGDYEQMGYLQMQILRMVGAKTTHHIVDIGCGSGRLAHQLAQNGFLNYSGYDVVEDLLSFARKKCPNQGFNFRRIEGTKITLPEQSADYVCFFSVFTHLLHEDSYRYLSKAKAILKPGGKIVFSFLTFDEPEHWKLFEQMVNSKEQTHHNQFMANSQIELWANNLDLKIQLLKLGSTPYIPIEKKIILDNGARFDEFGSIGQGVCVVEK